VPVSLGGCQTHEKKKRQNNIFTGDEWKKERGAYFVRPFLGPSGWDYPGGENRTSGFGIQLSKLKLKRN